MRYKSVLAAVGLLAASLTLAQPAGAAVPTAAQQATATCSLVLPARIAIRAGMNRVWGTLGSNCSAAIYTAVWKVPVGAEVASGDAKLAFEFGDRDSAFNVSGWTPPPGTLTFKPAGSATNESGHKIADLTAASTVAKWSSVATITGGHKGTKTALVTTVTHWDSAPAGFVRWPYKKMLLQYQEVGSSTWKGLAYVTTNSKGQATYTYYPGKSRKYRAYAAATSTTWDDFTPVLTR
jgi:hypothetical protein